MPNPDGTPDSIAEALAKPADFTGVPADADQSVAHRDLGLPRHYEGLLPGQRPYPWKCPHCGNDQVGHVEDGCTRCGAGKDGREGRPEVAVDPICRACRGAKTVSVKCKQCEGTGTDRVADDVCIDCGGAGTLTIDCRRCKETPGFDPVPQPQTERKPSMSHHDEDYATAKAHVPVTGMARIMSEKPLPTLEEAAPEPAVRYILTEIRHDGTAFSTEIAGSSTVQRIMQQARIQLFKDVYSERNK